MAEPVMWFEVTAREVIVGDHMWLRRGEHEVEAIRNDLYGPTLDLHRVFDFSTTRDWHCQVDGHVLVVADRHLRLVHEAQCAADGAAF